MNINAKQIWKILVILLYFLCSVNTKKNCKNFVLFICLFSSLVLFIFVNDFDKLFGGEYDKYGRSKRSIYFKGGQLSFWNLSHFLFFMFIGLNCPNSLLLIILLGVIWEGVELYLEYDRQTNQNAFLCKFINDCKNKKIVSRSKFWKMYTGNLDEFEKLFYCSSGYIGQLLDIFFNISGYLVGAYIHNNFKNYFSVLTNIYISLFFIILFFS